MHMISIFCSNADTVSSGSWFIVFNVLILSSYIGSAFALSNLISYDCLWSFVCTHRRKYSSSEEKYKGTLKIIIIPIKHLQVNQSIKVDIILNQ